MISQLLFMIIPDFLRAYCKGYLVVFRFISGVRDCAAFINILSLFDIICDLPNHESQPSTFFQVIALLRALGRARLIALPRATMFDSHKMAYI